MLVLEVDVLVVVGAVLEVGFRVLTLLVGVEMTVFGIVTITTFGAGAGAGVGAGTGAGAGTTGTGSFGFGRATATVIWCGAV